MRNKTLLTGLIIVMLYSAAGQVGAKALDSNAEPKSDHALQDGGSLELGIGFNVDSVPMYIGGNDDELGMVGRIAAAYQWKGLFFELNTDKPGIVPIGSELLMLGFNAYNNRSLSIDVVVGPEHGDRFSNDENHYKGLAKRKGDITGGIRATMYLGDYIAQIIARTELSDHHDGLSASALVGRNWQVGKFNVYSHLKLNYVSGNMADYYLGISAIEANDTFREYRVNDAFYSAAEFGVAYPLSESWVIRAKTSITFISDEIADSPILASDSNVRGFGEFTVNYVF